MYIIYIIIYYVYNVYYYVYNIYYYVLIIKLLCGWRGSNYYLHQWSLASQS